MSEEQKKEVTPESPAAVATPPAVEGPAAVPAAPATQAAAKTTRRRAPSVDKVAARHQKVLADALTQAAPAAAKPAKATKPAKAVKPEAPAAAEKAAKTKPVKAVKPVKEEKVAKVAKADKPAKPVKAVKPAKVEKPAKPRKQKLVRDSYAMPEAEYALIADLKKRLAALGSEVKKSELLRGGVAVLAALNDAELKAVMGRVERIKTGRPAKK